MSASREILVIGAGVLGLCAAVELTLRGHDVTVVDPGGANASSVAAGMLAPALESAIEGVTSAHAALLRDARKLWPAFAEATGIALDPTPAQWRGEGGDQIAERLARLGFAFIRQGDRIETPDDWRLDPDTALTRLKAGLHRPVVADRIEALERHGDRWHATGTRVRIAADVVVLATGASPALAGLPPEVARAVSAVIPIRGQIGRMSRTVDEVTRGRGGYIAPAADGAFIGATMDTGRRDLEPDAASAAALTSAVARFHDLDASPIDWRVGVRGATVDGLPLAGPSGHRGLHLALAPRRNGWLLGPLVARVVADAIEGGAPHDHAAALDPRRFSLPAG